MEMGKMFVQIIRRRCAIFALILIVNVFTFISLLAYIFETNQMGNKNNGIHRPSRFTQKSPRSYTTINDSSLGVVIKDFKTRDFRISHADRQRMIKDDVKKISEEKSRPLTQTQYKNVYIFSSIARRSRENASLDGVAVNIWETTTFSDRRAFCCLLYEDGTINKLPVIRKSSFLNNSITAVQVLCKEPIDDRPQMAVTIVYDNDVCPTSAKIYVKAAYPKQCSETFCFAICAKIAYDFVNPEMLIEWMEYYKHMHVSYIVVFTYNLTSTASDILKFYEKESWIEVLPFDYPLKGSPAHSPGDKNIASWSDEQLTVYDCHDRLRGFHYVGVIDLDEFLVPRRDNIQELLTSLSKQHPEAASFTFMTEIHALEWRQDTNSSHSLIPQYSRQNKARKDRNKVVHLPNLVEPGGIATHGIMPKLGYKRVVVLPQQATLKHYRPCRKEWTEEGTCYNQTLQTDKTMADIFSNIDERIVAVKSLLLG